MRQAQFLETNECGSNVKSFDLRCCRLDLKINTPISERYFDILVALNGYRGGPNRSHPEKATDCLQVLIQETAMDGTNPVELCWIQN
jgi:hypothetical protein